MQLQSSKKAFKRAKKNHNFYPSIFFYFLAWMRFFPADWNDVISNKMTNCVKNFLLLPLRGCKEKKKKGKRRENGERKMKLQMIKLEKFSFHSVAVPVLHCCCRVMYSIWKIISTFYDTFLLSVVSILYEFYVCMVLPATENKDG